MREDAERLPEAMDRVTVWLDYVLVPAAWGIVSVAVLAQGLLAMPAVRHRLDHRIAQMVATTGQPVPQSKAADVRLSISPWPTPSEVTVEVNGRTYMPNMDGRLTVQVTPGQQIVVSRPQADGVVYVTIDHDDPFLVVPAPGQSLALGIGETRGEFPAAQFLPG